MAVAAFVVSVLALAAAAWSVIYTRRATHVAEAADRRDRTPRLALIAENSDEDLAKSVFYRLRNDGPQDLDDVTLFRPRPADGLEYRLARVGLPWADDEISLGPLAMTQEARFVLGCGAATPWPDFRVRVEARAGSDTWPLVEVLAEPSRGLNVW